MTPTPLQHLLEQIGITQSWAPLAFESIIVIGFVSFTVASSGFVVRRFIQPFTTGTARQTEHPDIRAPDPDTGRIVGKCENVLVVLFVVADAITGLALIFTAKAFVRQKEFQQNPRYYLVGTMVNITYSVVIGVLARLALAWGRGAGQLP